MEAGCLPPAADLGIRATLRLAWPLCCPLSGSCDPALSLALHPDMSRVGMYALSFWQEPSCLASMLGLLLWLPLSFYFCCLCPTPWTTPEGISGQCTLVWYACLRLLGPFLILSALISRNWNPALKFQHSIFSMPPYFFTWKVHAPYKNYKTHRNTYPPILLGNCRLQLTIYF